MDNENRNYSLDLLRIIAMIMIVSLHVLLGTGLLTRVPYPSNRYFGVWLLEGLSIIAVNLYVFISGYFLVKSPFRLKKVTALVRQVLFYSILGYLVLLFTGLTRLSPLSLVKAILPVITGQYWFVSAYIGMYLLSPFLNNVINKMSRKQHLGLCALIVSLFSIWPTFLSFNNAVPVYNVGSGYSISWFIVLYIIAAYIRLHYVPDHKTIKHTLWYLLFAMLVPASIWLFTAIYSSTNNATFFGIASSLYSYNALPVLLASIFAFILFLNIKLTSKLIVRLVSFLAPLTFGVYLVHMNPSLAPMIWPALPMQRDYSTPLFTAEVILSIIAIYSASTLVDYIRKQIFNICVKFGFLVRLRDKIDSKLSSLVDNVLKSLYKHF